MREVDVGALLEERKLNRFHALTLGLCVLILFVDGLDFSASNVGAPSIIRGLGIERSEMSFIQSSGYFGIFVGSLLFGYLGDKYGRRFGAILGVLAYSIPGLLTVFVTSYEQLAVLRFFTGLGMGGVVPNVIALLNETAPKRYRATFVMIGYVGYSMGNAVIAQVAAWFVPAFGWPVIFVVASIVGLLLCAFLLFALPELISYLTVTNPEAPQLKRLVSRLVPDQDFTASRFVLNRPAAEKKFSLSLLFSGYRRIATPLLWLTFFSEFLTYMTLASVLSLVLEDAGLAAHASVDHVLIRLCRRDDRHSRARAARRLFRAEGRRCLRCDRGHGAGLSRHAGIERVRHHRCCRHRARVLFGHASIDQRDRRRLLSDDRSRQRRRLCLGMRPHRRDHRSDDRERVVCREPVASAVPDLPRGALSRPRRRAHRARAAAEENARAKDRRTDTGRTAATDIAINGDTQWS